MKPDRCSISIDTTVYARFKKFCDANNFKVAKQVEKVLLNYIVNLEKDDENNNNLHNM